MCVPCADSSQVSRRALYSHFHSLMQDPIQGHKTYPWLSCRFSFRLSVPVPWPLLVFYDLEIFFSRVQGRLDVSDVSSGIESGSALMAGKQKPTAVMLCPSLCVISGGTCFPFVSLLMSLGF